MALQFETGKLHAVYHPIGSVNGEPRFKRANFDVLDWSATSTGIVQRYVLPLGFQRVTDSDLNDNDRVAGSDAIDVGQEFGFYSNKFFVVEQSEGSGQEDSLFSVHSFGYL